MYLILRDTFQYYNRSVDTENARWWDERKKCLSHPERVIFIAKVRLEEVKILYILKMHIGFTDQRWNILYISLLFIYSLLCHGPVSDSALFIDITHSCVVPLKLYTSHFDFVLHKSVQLWLSFLLAASSHWPSYGFGLIISIPKLITVCTEKIPKVFCIDSWRNEFRCAFINLSFFPHICVFYLLSLRKTSVFQV